MPRYETINLTITELENIVKCVRAIDKKNNEVFGRETGRDEMMIEVVTYSLTERKTDRCEIKFKLYTGTVSKISTDMPKVL